MVFEFNLDTQRQNFHNITVQVAEAVHKSGVENGICTVYCPHTTAGITINENADPGVVSDMCLGLDQVFPDRPEFQHIEGNSAAHLKASCVGTSVQIPIQGGSLLLGRWQAIYFCEFDGPRRRRFLVYIANYGRNEG